MSEDDLRQSAADLFRQAYEQQMAGEFQRAIDLYTSSIEAFPTAEAYTFRGWTYSFSGEYDRAIADCLEAIRVDPDFGNPYNDIGAYLIEQEKWEEAVPWFEKAIAAKRYEARAYPHFNLGRVYEHSREWEKAKACYGKAYALDTRYVAALTAWRRLQAMFN
ncbi:MAG: tetratricopeptide repeat protein [Acidobacteria bacterium]|jgi:tetratricopeptide (TPR) repeat protein|nr:tetratricopeptide repeat protein [Acidobacteriota bacterium]